MKVGICRRMTVKLGTVLIASALASASSLAGVPAVSHVTVADVTPRSFSVVWAASEASTPALAVFDDAAGTVPTVGAGVRLQPLEAADPALAVAAENLGALKVQVTGLAPDTAYYFRMTTTSKSTSESVVYPAGEPLPEVITRRGVARSRGCGPELLPLSNDLVAVECYLPDGVTPAEGALLVVTVEGGDYPVSRFVGDGAAPPLAYADLNNLFGALTQETLELHGGERLVVTQLMGIHGVSTHAVYVPRNQGMAQLRMGLPAPPCEGDLDLDLDVDGFDLSVFSFAPEVGDCGGLYPCIGLLDTYCEAGRSDHRLFAADFGRADCP